jgi:uncharacterized integral membrane protein
VSNVSDQFPREQAGKGAGNDEGPPVGKLVGIAVVVVAAIIFVAQNRDRTKFKFLFVDTDSRTWVLILVAFVLGAITGILGAAMRRRRKQD